MRALWILALLAIVGGALHVRGAPKAAPLHPDDPRTTTGKNGVVLLAAEWCGYCRKLQDDFSRAGVRHRVLDIDTPQGARALRAVGAPGVPVTIVGQHVIRGYDPAALDKTLVPLGYRVY